ncbi:MAG: ECF transporter S component [Bacteroidales bacterium]|jgi:hypothetical protein|nr:ECF transporter S component [Bacteroidales bacterium]
MTTTTYNLSLKNLRTYIFAVLFIVGNIVLPQLAHLVPNGGHIFLPIYFFTLIGAYKYGFWVGLITAIMSPLTNMLLFGMPPAAALPAIMIKSILLAVAAAYFAKQFNGKLLLGILLSVIACQLLGMSFEWIYKGSLIAALQDVIIGYPGIAFQVFGGYLLIKYVLK